MSNIPNFSITTERLVTDSNRSWLIRIKFFLPCLAETLYTTTGFEYTLKSSFLKNMSSEELEIVCGAEDAHRDFLFLAEQLRKLEQKYQNAYFAIIKHDNSNREYTFISLDTNLKIGDRVLVDTRNGNAEGTIVNFLNPNSKITFHTHPTRKIIKKLY